MWDRVLTEEIEELKRKIRRNSNKAAKLRRKGENISGLLNANRLLVNQLQKLLIQEKKKIKIV